MNKKIFIIDDDPFWTTLLSAQLNTMGYKDLHSFHSGREGIDNIHLNPEVIFLDYQMEDIDGLKVLEKVKNYYPGIKVIFCTAYEDLGVALTAIDKGSFDYLLKANLTGKNLRNLLLQVENESIAA